MSLTYPLLLLLLLILSMSNSCFAYARHHRRYLQIYWNSSNRLFHSSGYITVYLGNLLDFVCPYYEDDHSNTPIEYNALYLVNENDYYHCNTTDYTPLIRCNRPFDSQRLIYTLSVSNYLPYPNLPEFEGGQYYYFISTASGQLEGIDQRSAGLCYMKNMKLILHVQKYPRHAYEQRRKPSKLILAKRTNVTLTDPVDRTLSSPLLSSAAASRNSSFIFLSLVLCLLTKSKT